MEFKTGQKVESLVTAQGMLKGEQYVVVAVARVRYFNGVYTKLSLVGYNGVRAEVGNPSLVLKVVA